MDKSTTLGRWADPFSCAGALGRTVAQGPWADMLRCGSAQQRVCPATDLPGATDMRQGIRHSPKNNDIIIFDDSKYDDMAMS